MQVDDAVEADISKREKARLKEMQRIKNQKIQEILDAQNAAIDADMVSHPLKLLLDIIALLCFLIRFYV